MNLEELGKVVQQTQEAMHSLLKIKGGEYANSDDRLANFKRGANLTGVTPLQVLFVYLSKHYDGVASFIRKSANGEPLALSEPIEGRLDDIIVYCTLAKAIIKEDRAIKALERDRDSHEHRDWVFGQHPASEVRPATVRIPSNDGDERRDNSDVHSVESHPGVFPAAPVQSPPGGLVSW